MKKKILIIPLLAATLALASCRGDGGEQTPTHTHNYGSLVAKEEATCLKDGHNAYYYCEECNTYFDENKNATTMTDLTIAKTNHDMDPDLKKDKDYHYNECKNCHEKSNQVLHTWDTGNVTKEATETETGTIVYTCTVCGYEDSRTIPVTTHTHNYKTEVIDPTCELQGYTQHTCAECGDSYKDTYTDATGHSYGLLIAMVPATETEAGRKAHYQCSKCNKYFDENKKPVIWNDLLIPATGSGTSNNGSYDDGIEWGELHK